jgi:hypothetical protein
MVEKTTILANKTNMNRSQPCLVLLRPILWTKLFVESSEFELWNMAT